MDIEKSNNYKHRKLKSMTFSSPFKRNFSLNGNNFTQPILYKKNQQFQQSFIETPNKPKDEFKNETNCLFFSFDEPSSQFYLFNNNLIPSEPSPKKNVNNFKNAILSKEKFLNALNIKTAKAIEFSNKFRNEKENFYQVLVKNQNLSIQIHEMQEQIIKKKHILAKLKANTNNRYETKKTIKNLIEILLGVELKNLHFIENKEYYLKCRFEKICDLNLFLLLENNGNLFINYNITGCDLSHYESFQEIIIIVMEEFVIEAKNYSNFNECFKNFCFLIKYVSSFFEILLNFYSIWKEKFFIEFYIVNKRLCLKMMSFEKIELIFSQANWLAEPIMLVWRKKEKEITFNKFQKTINEILCNELVGEFELENIIKEFLL